MQITAEVKLNPGPFDHRGLMSVFLLLLTEESQRTVPPTWWSLHRHVWHLFFLFSGILPGLSSTDGWEGRMLMMKSRALEKHSNGFLILTFSSRPSAPPLVSIWLHVRTADRSAAGPPPGPRPHPRWWHSAPFSPFQLGLRRDPELRMTHQHFRSAVSSHQHPFFPIIMELMFSPADS